MRIDKYLKVARLTKRRVVAKVLLEEASIKVNGRNVKPSYEVKLNDEIELCLGRHHLIVKVTNVREFANKDQASDMFEVLKDEIVDLNQDS